jgi:uncharacterized membrane protein YkoI
MSRRFVIVAIALAAIALIGGATLAVGGGSGLIWDDRHTATPGSLDPGMALHPQATIPHAQAVATARHAATGQLGQVDLEHFGTRIVYMVDVGNQEVRVDAANGTVVAIGPRD